MHESRWEIVSIEDVVAVFVCADTAGADRAAQDREDRSIRWMRAAETMIFVYKDTEIPGTAMKCSGIVSDH